MSMCSPGQRGGSGGCRVPAREKGAEGAATGAQPTDRAASLRAGSRRGAGDHRRRRQEPHQARDAADGAGGRARVRRSGRSRPGATDQPTDDLREQVRYLREQLRRGQDAHAEARRIIAGLVQGIPELEAPREAEARETPETATAETEGTSAPRSDSPGPQRPVERPQSGTLRGLRRRILGW